MHFQEMLKQMLVFCFVLGLRVLIFFLILALYHLASAVVNTAGHQQVTGPIVIHLMLMGMLFFLILVLGSSLMVALVLLDIIL